MRRFAWPMVCFVSALAGFALGAARPSSPAPAPVPADVAVAAVPTAPPVAPGRAARPVLPPDAGCDARLAEESAYRAQLEGELYGDPIPWPATVAPAYTEAGYAERLDRVLAECMPGARRSAMDCSEPPCIAAVWDPPPDQGLGRCEAWVEAYGIATTQSSQSVDCGDGTKRRLILLSPSDVVIAPGDDLFAAAAGRDPVDSENRGKRLDTRWAALRQDLPCPP